MPKVGTHRIQFNDGVKEFDIWYTSKDGFTLKNFPENILQTVGSADGTWIKHQSTEAACRQEYNNVVARYYELTKSERHVIVIKMSLGCGITMNRVDKHRYAGHQDWFKNFRTMISDSGFGGLPYAIAFDYETGVIIKDQKDLWADTTHDETGAVTYRSSHVKKFNPDNYCVVLDYSIETELFLKGIQMQMTVLAKKMALFFTDETKLLSAISSKQLLIENK